MKCEICGRPITYGYMTDDEGSFHVHDKSCFEEYMDKTYGKHQWMSLGGNVMDTYGGYYLVSCPNDKGFSGTGIFYTEKEDNNA